MTMVGKNPEDYEKLLVTSLSGRERANAAGFTHCVKITPAVLTNETADGTQTLKVADVASGDLVGPALLHVKSAGVTRTVTCNLKLKTDGTSFVSQAVSDGQAGDSFHGNTYVATTAADELELVLTPGTGEKLSEVEGLEVFILFGHIPTKEYADW